MVQYSFPSSCSTRTPVLNCLGSWRLCVRLYIPLCLPAAPLVSVLRVSSVWEISSPPAHTRKHLIHPPVFSAHISRLRLTYCHRDLHRIPVHILDTRLLLHLPLPLHGPSQSHRNSGYPCPPTKFTQRTPENSPHTRRWSGTGGGRWIRGPEDAELSSCDEHRDNHDDCMSDLDEFGVEWLRSVRGRAPSINPSMRTNTDDQFWRG
ncbi:hypothetical protein D9619_000419 [Psilocybe cf. subviscida]|uniref:Uncharacterized protein n=1 Tax=Psilocybe cf. subviscida TaxID=2480587 RepID=A0A8H5F2U5_9AGAR|nr:hypothetical protein D9619_000419 [Psilocybe cf. subviscida]